MSATAFRFSAHLAAFAAIDASAGVIRGVSVITEGDAKGHGMRVDATTLEQVKACAAEYRGGLKVKMTHQGDAGDIVGYLTAFRIEGEKLLADLHLLKTSPHREYLLELAATIPDTFGLSISFAGPVEERDGQAFARCTEIYSADVVSEPAANPTGLFSVTPTPAPADAGQPQPTHSMEDKKPDPMAELKAAVDSLTARLSKLESAAAPAAPAPDAEKEMSAKLEKVAELAAQNALKTFAAQFGTPPTAPSAAKDVEPKKTEKKFEELVREHPDYSKSKKSALAAVIKANPAAYADYNQRVKSGEVIMF